MISFQLGEWILHKKQIIPNSWSQQNQRHTLIDRNFTNCLEPWYWYFFFSLSSKCFLLGPCLWEHRVSVLKCVRWKIKPEEHICMVVSILFLKLLIARETLIKFYLVLWSQFACWWPSTIRHQDICRHCDDQVWVYVYRTWMLNPLRANFFQREHKHIFTFCVISPHWYDTGSWNPSSNKTRTYLFYIVNIMAADVLAT